MIRRSTFSDVLLLAFHGVESPHLPSERLKELKKVVSGTCFL